MLTVSLCRSESGRESMSTGWDKGERSRVGEGPDSHPMTDHQHPLYEFCSRR